MPNHESVERLRKWVAERASDQGRTAFEEAALCLYRFDKPTTMSKAPTFGVTFAVVLSGSKITRLGNTELHSNPDQHLVITRQTDHVSSVAPAKDGPFLSLSLTFHPELVARALVALSDMAAPQTAEEVPGFELAFDPKVIAALERYLAAREDPVEAKVLAPLAVEEIIFRLLRSDAAATLRGSLTSGHDNARLVESMRFMRANLAKKHDVAKLARQVAMSPSHYAHRFSELVRTSPMKYLREVRLSASKDLLARPGARIGEVALEVGFESPAHFTREFKRRFGDSPRGWVTRQFQS
ncbi:MAG: AraC family transcriptional regulator [Archangium sp.]